MTASQPSTAVLCVQLVALAAACAIVEALAFLGVRSMPVTVRSVALACVAWWAVFLLAVGGAWVVARRSRL
jgi:hypothetical protein